MISIHVIFIAVVIVFTAAAFLAMFNLAHLKKISQRINSLETEVEKRAKQMDQLKKESSQGVRNISEETPSGGIEIVRSTRDQFGNDSEGLGQFKKEQLQIYPETVRVQLLNETSMMADFNNLWRNLKNAVQSGSKLVDVEFAGIESLQKQEIEYLYKICSFAAKSGCSVNFSGCSQPLGSMLFAIPAMRPFFKGIQ